MEQTGWRDWHLEGTCQPDRSYRDCVQLSSSALVLCPFFSTSIALSPYKINNDLAKPSLGVLTTIIANPRKDATITEGVRWHSIVCGGVETIGVGTLVFVAQSCFLMESWSSYVVILALLKRRDAWRRLSIVVHIGFNFCQIWRFFC